MKEFTAEQIEALFDMNGPIPKVIPDYHHRKEQVNLSREVSQALVNREFLVAEAGTGVGKTLAYLIPTVSWSVLEGERVVVSTRTRALQQQIMEKDIPALREILPFSFEAAELKGRDNYMCWNKYQSILGGRRSLEPEEQRFMELILTWAERTRSGDRMELQLPGSMMKHWPLLSADRYSCRKELCRYHEKCFRLKAARASQKAQVVITNHSLLLSDVGVEHSILPDYSCLVIDEAHAFDRETFDKLSCVLSRFDIERWFNSLYHKDLTHERGYLQSLRMRFAHLAENINLMRPLVDQGWQLADKLFALLDKHLGAGSEFSRVIRSDELDSRWFADVFDIYQEWQAELHLLLKGMEKLREELRGEEEEADLLSYILTLQEFSNSAYTIFEEDLQRNDRLLWVDLFQGKVQSLCSSMVEVGNELETGLYQHLSTLVMVSATLAVENSFDHVVRRNGLTNYMQQGRVRTLLEQSPFRYEEQAGLLMVKDMVNPAHEEFNQQVTEALYNIKQAVPGRVMALFTSRRQLTDVSSLLRPLCDQLGINLLVHHEDGDFGTLMDSFLADENSLLMGLDTYWEGVDLKGDLLKCLVIVKLPFRAPSDPYCSASEKYCLLNRLNSFNYFMLPDAAVRFKQGIGRLIRSEEDRGVVIILDSRLARQAYGRVFQNSSPIPNRIAVSRHELSQYISKWI